MRLAVRAAGGHELGWMNLGSTAQVQFFGFVPEMLFNGLFRFLPQSLEGNSNPYAVHL